MWPFNKKQPVVFPSIERRPLSPSEAFAWFTLVNKFIEQKAMNEKLGLVLEGGGAKGAWQAGYLLRMEELGLLQLINMISGTSVGGLNALVLRRYWGSNPAEQLVSVWRSISSPSAIYKGELPLSVGAVVKGLMGGRLKAEGWLDTSPLKALVEKHLDADSLNVENRPAVWVCAADYRTKHLAILGAEFSMVDRALATSAVPGAFPPHTLADGRVMMDGGCSLNLPYPVLLNEGATKLVCLYCDPEKASVGTEAMKPNSLNTATGALGALMQAQSDRSYEELLKELELRQLRGEEDLEIHHAYPSAPTGGLLDFGSKPELLQLGYNDAVKFLTIERAEKWLMS